jgi:hypothetical protein
MLSYVPGIDDVDSYFEATLPNSARSRYLRRMLVHKLEGSWHQITSPVLPVADENLTYALTTNSLYPTAYSNANLPWFSFFPFANWQIFDTGTYPNISPVQKALIETLTLAAPYAPKTGQVFIDVANYSEAPLFLSIVCLTQLFIYYFKDNVDEHFLNQTNPQGTVMDHIAQYINSLPDDVTPILRVLIAISPSCLGGELKCLVMKSV